MAARIRAVLFDKDGTLLDYHRTWGPINRRAATIAGAGDASLAARLLAAGGMDDATGITRADSLLAAANTAEIAAGWIADGSPLGQDELTAALDALFTAAADGGYAVTDLPALFATLKARGLKLGIASSDSEGAIRRFAVHHGVDGLLDFIAGYDSGHGVKPGGGMVTAFAASVGVPAAEVAVAGDNLHDMAMAKAGGAGLRIGVLTGTGTAATLGPASDLVLASVAELPAALGDAG